uniref:Uncharacterized protein n=1 Tax=Trieres chinensis TaxID=1514140 RepID=A0A7S1ZPR9_TRICV|mmetsp:Transcript_30020/g.61260  ORF Transcript_30020/g.61260 Transcript_30020/m.61260 type:complete len:199 (+) Transcript_30020:86-682(+)|eukprot:CAMPEP_0183295776 /NCGR_PEP_ID=MMETSP0160_2-20130417/3606_1 /TAXON_ID=2839 ORGANISM="Odontella Sinensis, Strain Grunow 1884" /NCGR_SAMPLE_ID=MMETSP0160_2 /ASSEMBLY_ACC=CAM_ASM_000250 /LENGTH=198 /DNA_ID=CAMNT_0025457309 /DNA_START=65 /DNA_END=661 /DNA_ORIENTATION=+
MDLRGNAEHLPSLNFNEPAVQMQIISMHEKASASAPSVKDGGSPELHERMWLAEFNAWTVNRDGCRDEREAGGGGEATAVAATCGRDVMFPAEGSICMGTWVENSRGLMLRSAYPDLGICLPTNLMHPDDLAELASKGLYDPVVVSSTDDSSSWCPVFKGWSEAKSDFCVEAWSRTKGIRFTDFDEVEEMSNEEIREL